MQLFLPLVSLPSYAHGEAEGRRAAGLGEARRPGGSQGRLLSEAEASTLMGFTDTKLLLSKFSG